MTVLTMGSSVVSRRELSNSSLLDFSEKAVSFGFWIVKYKI